MDGGGQPSDEPGRSTNKIRLALLNANLLNANLLNALKHLLND